MHWFFAQMGFPGLVSDTDILRTIEQNRAAGERLYHLIEQANENGGPDNVTAIVVRVLEVGMKSPTLRRPAFSVVASILCSQDILAEHLIDTQYPPPDLLHHILVVILQHLVRIH